jgi:hypothetical protein
MAESKQRPFAYNPSGETIPGTEQLGSLAIGWPTDGFESTNLDWWNGPNESGYIIAIIDRYHDSPLSNLNLGITQRGTGIIVSQKKGFIQIYQKDNTTQTALTDKRVAKESGKYMFSIEIVDITTGSSGTSGSSGSSGTSGSSGVTALGIGTIQMNFEGGKFGGGFPGCDPWSVGFLSNGEYWYNGMMQSNGLPTWSKGDQIDIIIDTKTDVGAWVRVNGGPWNGDNKADPSRDNGGIESFINSIYVGEEPAFPALCPGPLGTMTILNKINAKWRISNMDPSLTFFGNKISPIGFYRSTNLSNKSFTDLVSKISQTEMPSVIDAYRWVIDSGYWTSFNRPLTIDTNLEGGLDGWDPVAFSISPNSDIGTVYSVGSQIIFQNGEIRTITQIDDYSPTYMDIFYDSAIGDSVLFPITIISP